MVENAPSSVDLQEFQFKLHSKLKIFDNNNDSNFKNAYNLVTAASRYGLVFIGSPNATIEVIQLKSIENSSVTKVESSNFPKRSVPLSAVPSHLAVNCDQTLLAVICYKNDCAIAIVYNVTSFLSQNVAVLREIRVSATPGVSVLEACWNPTMPRVLTACKADGSLGVYNITDTSVDINELPVAAAARCFCWSPKGKQLVVGSTNGSLTQYKPDLKAVKVIQAPGLVGSGPYCTLSVCWVSNYQFVAVYRDMGNQEVRPAMVMVNSPKAGSTTYINYDDICFSFGTLRPPQYYIIHQPTWGVMLVSSANSMEVGVLGVSTPGEPALWQQWNQIDAGRAEMPLSSARQETFPVGVAFDTGVTTQIPWGENQVLPPMPLIHLLSHHGVMCSYSVINIRQGAQCLCTPPEPVADQSGLRLFQQAASTPAAVQQPAPGLQQRASAQAKPQPATTAPTQPSFGAPASTALPFGAAPSSASTFGASASTASTFGAPASSPAPTYSLPASSAPAFSLPASSAPAFTSLASPPAFGAPVSIAASSVPAPGSTVNTSFMPAVSTTSQPGSLLGWTAGSTLFGPGTSPNFGNLTATAQTSQPAVASTPPFNFKVGMTAESMPVKVAPSPVSSAPGLGNGANLSGFMGGISVASSVQTTTPSIFGGLSTPSVSKPSTPTTSMFGLGSNAPSFGALNMTTPKPSTPVVSVTPSPSIPANVPAPAQQTPLTMFTPAPQVSKPLLSTPKPTIKSDVTPQTQQQTPSSNETSKKDESVVNDQIMQGLIKEEVKNFQSELQELFKRCKTIKLDVGTEEEKIHLVLTTESLLEFHKELQDTTDSQVAEVHYLKQALMQSFAWYEDTKARHRRYTDPNFSSLLQAQELDPISEKQLGDIKHLIYYIEAQLKQVDSFLDNQWADFQDSCKKQVKGKLQIPTLEPIYQSLVRQNAILERHRYLLKDISARIKSRNKKASAYPHVMNFNNLTNNKDSEIDEELRKLKLDHEDLFTVRYDKILKQKNKFTGNKQSKLCSFFTKRNVIHITPKKPKFVNSLLNTPSKLNSFTTALGVQRNLAQNFDNSAVEANISASNLFSFTLLDGAHSTKNRSPEKSTAQKSALMFNGPKTDQIKQIVSPKVAANIFNISSASSNTSSSSVFSFTASTTSVTQSGDSNSQTMMFSGASNNTKAPVSKFGLSQINTNFTQPKPEAKEIPVSKPEVTIIKPTVQKSSAAEIPTMFGSLAEIKPAQSQPFSFAQPQTKPTPVPVAKPAFFSDRDSIEPSFNFGNALSLGQQSTPKPKLSGTSLAQVTIATSKPVITVATTQIVPTKSSLPSVAASTTATAAKSEPMLATTSASIFGGLAAKPSSSGTFLGQQTSTNTPGSFFGSIQTAPTSASGSLFSAKPTTPTTVASPATLTSTSSSGFSFAQSEPAKPASIFGSATGFAAAATTTTSTSATATGFSFLQPAASNAGAVATTAVAASAATPKIAAVFNMTENKPTEPSTTSITVSTAAPTQSSFGFGALSETVAETTADNKFSFGNLTVSALSPSSTVATIASTTGFGFPSAEGTTTPATTSPTTNSSVFGGFGGPFGKPATAATTSTASSFIGQPICSPSSFTQPQTSGSLFGQSTGNIFAQKSDTSSVSSTSIFGQSSGGSPFGQVASTPAVTAASATSIFGQTASSPFGAPASTASTTGGSIFGQSSAFGAGAATTTSGSIFGQSTFGNPAATSSASSFSFTQTAGATSFGSSGGSIFGVKPAFGGAPAFGQPAAGFGAPPIFGGSPTGGNVFGNPAPAASTTGSNFGGGFGSPSTFGQKPAFGSPPAFGQQSAFGSPPAFGSSPSFGSPSRLFGATASPPTGTFGSAIQENSTFANLATQPTLGFGNLVQNQPTPPQQQQQQQQQPQFSGGAQFSSWR